MTDPLDDTSNIGAAIKAVGQRKTDDTVLQVLLCVQKLDAKVTAHIQDEEAMHAKFNHELAEGGKRMDYIERELSVITKLVEKAAGFIKGVHIAGAVLLFSLSILTWILVEKNSDMKSIALTVAGIAQRDGETQQQIKNMQEMALRDMAVLERHIVSADRMMLENSIKIEGLSRKR